ncbi:MAG TPA: GTPase Era [Wenzhouxiangellaceae bacterium]|nr:GTPase Era [Wenzhouxiangellaceae bacterium]
MNEATETRSGTVALIGRPNAGKSTLLNRLVGERVSIVTHKPQTTRHRVTGIVNRAGGQLVLVDTPGLHRRRDHALNRHLNRVAAEALRGVDLAVLVVDASAPTEEDEAAARAVAQSEVGAVLVLNKIDRVKLRSDLLPLARLWSERLNPLEVFFVSALKGDGIDTLADGLVRHLPVQPPLFPPDEFTSESSRFLAAEIIRGQLLENLHQEVPYGTTVLIESFEEARGKYRIGALILVAEKRHKGMVIGQGATTLKRIGTRSRMAMQALFGVPVHLDLNVRVEEGWMDREGSFPRLGYNR